MRVRGLIDAAGGTEDAATSRSGERTHLFLDASLTLGASSVRVRVRNLSTTGALIEGPVNPAIGATVTLHRGALAIAGRTMWVAPGRCGIQFDAPLAVADWMPVKSSSRHSSEASVTAVPLASVTLPFDPTLTAFDRKSTALAIDTDHPAAAAESESTTIARAIEELVSLQSDMHAAHEALGRRRVNNHPELEALESALKRIEGIAMALQNV